MKKIIALIIFCFSFSFIFAEKKTYSSAIDTWVEIDDNSITFNYCDPFENDVCKTYNYTLEKKENFEWLSINNNGTKKTFLLLKSEEFLILYESTRKEPFFWGFYSFRKLELLSFLKKTNVTTSSELQENKTIYSGDSLGNLNLESPWVEGSKGDGIGEYIILNINASEVFILSGFISYQKPYLYEQNNRPKKIKISFPESNYQDIYFDLADTPNPQKITLKEDYNGKLKIEIIDIYKGSKYSDLCISSIPYLH